MMQLRFEQFPALAAIEICRHGFTQRIPAVDTVHDKTEVLSRLDAAHREIRKAVGVGDWPLFTGQQIHGNKVAVIDSLPPFQSRSARLSTLERGEDEGEGLERTRRESTLTVSKGEATQGARGHGKIPAKTEILERGQQEFPGCDGIISNQRGIALGVHVADCCAVYIVDPKTPAIGLVHSGRKGTELGVVPNAIEQMIDRFGSNPANMIVQLSPCIHPPHYEIDFAAEIVRECRAQGVSEIHDSGVCTACHVDRYYSYRAEKGKTGRMLALLGISAPEL
jgi:copper oxidase (laccase) domain-containing protein